MTDNFTEFDLETATPDEIAKLLDEHKDEVYRETIAMEFYDTAILRAYANRFAVYPTGYQNSSVAQLSEKDTRVRFFNDGSATGDPLKTNVGQCGVMSSDGVAIFNKIKLLVRGSRLTKADYALFAGTTVRVNVGAKVSAEGTMDVVDVCGGEDVLLRMEYKLRRFVHLPCRQNFLIEVELPPAAKAVLDHVEFMRAAVDTDLNRDVW